MSWFQTQALMVEAAGLAMRFAANWLLQSSLLVFAGLGIGWWVRRRGSAVQSVVYRTTLLAVLVCPLATWGLSLAGVSGWSLDMPSAWSQEAAVAPALEKVAMISDHSEPAEAKAGVEAERREQNLPVPGPAIFPGSDVGSPELLVAQDPRVGSSAAENSSPEVPAQEVVNAPAGTDARVAETVLPIAAGAVSKPPTISNFGLWAIGFCILWAVIALALLVRLGWAWCRMVQLCRHGAEADASLVAVCRELALMFRVPVPKILYSPYVSSPCLAGLSRPTILLPEMEPTTPVRDVLIHELAHLRRRDCHWNLLRQAVTAVFFFQPLFWKLGRRLEATAEEVCDDYVVQFGGDRTGYAHQLLDMAERRLASVPMGVGMLSLKSLLARRVIRVLDTSRSLSTRVGNLLLIAVITGGLIGTMIAGLVGLGQEPSQAIAAQEPQAQASEPSKSDEPQKPAKAVDEKPTPQLGDDQRGGETYRGYVVDEKGKPISGAELYWIRSRVHEIDPAPPKLVATTNAQGEFEFSTPAFANASPEEPAGWEFHQKIVVKAKGHGVVLTYPGEFQPTPPRLTDAETKVPTIQLPTAGNSVRGTLLDIEGKPLQGATVRIRWFNEQQERRDWFLEDAKARDERDAVWRSRVNHLLAVIEPYQLRQALPMARTNAQGQFELQDIGPDRLFQLLIEGEGLESTELIVRNEPGEIIEIAPDRHGVNEARNVLPREFVQVIGPSNPIAGRVLDWKTGEPIAGAVVRAFGVHGERISSSRERQHFAATTDAEGRYQVTGLPVGKNNELVAFTTGDVPYIPVAHKVNTSGSSREAVVQDFRLKQGLWAEGRVFDKTSDKPFTGEITYYFFANPEWEADVPGIRRAFLDGRYWTDSKGEFRVPVLPSRGVLAFRYSGRSMDRDGIDRYPRGQGAERLEGATDLGGVKAFPTRPRYLTPANYERVAEVHPKADEKTIRVDIALIASRPVVVKVVDDKNQPLADYQVYGASERSGWERKSEDRFEISDLKPEEKRKVFVFHRQQNLAGAAVVMEGEEDSVQISLGTAGRVTGRLVDEDGEPITDASLFADYEKLREDEKTAIWAPHPKLYSNPTTIPVDKEGRFELDGLIPGWKYHAYASAPRKFNGNITDLVLGNAFQNVEIALGETKGLGDVAPARPEMDEAKPQNAPKAEAAPPSLEVEGHVTDEKGQPIAGANIAVVADEHAPSQGGTGGSDMAVLVNAMTDQTGGYRLNVKGVSSKTHRYANLLVRKDGLALAWKDLNLDETRALADFRLEPEEPLRGKLIDVEGQPASGIRLVVKSLLKREENRPLATGIRYNGDADRAPAWIAPVTSDKAGRFTIPGVPKGYGVFVEVDGGERFAPQDMAISTDLPEQRPENDGTYRSQVKNAKPGEEVTLVLPPAQVFEGRVTYEDTGEPAPFARVSVWASQQKLGGSMVSVFGKADANGRYRISAKPGVRFGLKAYPPEGVPYLARQMPYEESIVWESGERVKEVNMTLPRGVLVKGLVQSAGSETPVAGATIQYIPESSNNPNDTNDILTGWQDTKVSKKDGTFETVILPGSGRLLIQRPGGNFVFQVIGRRELYRGTPGGLRNYAHAIERVNPEPDANSFEVRISLQPGEAVKGRIVDEAGKAVDQVELISRLNISPYSATWRGGGAPIARGGEFEIMGLEKDKEYPMHFLHPERKLGATAVLKAGDREPTVVLKRCGQAKCRLVDAEGRPVADHESTVEMVVTPGPHHFDSKSAQAGKLAGDSDFIQNVDRLNQGDRHVSDKDGRMLVPALIPGATYQIVTRLNNEFQIAKVFQTKADETLDLGDITVERRPKTP